MKLFEYLCAVQTDYQMEYLDSLSFEDHIRKEGIEMGEERFGQLTLSLITDKRYEDIERAATDKEYMEQLYIEYHLQMTDE